MNDPRNNNPFANDMIEMVEFTNESDANKALAETAKKSDLNDALLDMFGPFNLPSIKRS